MHATPVFKFIRQFVARWCPGFSRFPPKESPKGYTPAQVSRLPLDEK